MENYVEIVKWTDASVIHSGDFHSIKECLEDGVNKGISFNHAKLNYARLNYAELNYAKLNHAKLNGAELNYAKLNHAKLNGAELNNAELNCAEAVCIPSGEKYWLYISNDVVVAGCQSLSPQGWANVTKQELEEMEGDDAIEYHPRLMKLINFFLGLEL